MKVIVSSTNPVKLDAVLIAFRSYFRQVDIEGVKVDAGVLEQPLTDTETRESAHNHAREIRKRIYDADYWVGIEEGVQAEEQGLDTFAWIVIYSAGKYGEARTATFKLPEKIAHLIAGGMDLAEAIDLVFSETNSKQNNGAVGHLTQHRVDRTELYRQAVVLALIPFVNPDLY